MRLAYMVSALALMAAPASAAVLLDVRGGDRWYPKVEVKVTGSLDLAGLGDPVTQAMNFYSGPLIDPHGGRLSAGRPSLGAYLQQDIYANAFNAPDVPDFGAGEAPEAWAISTQGDFFGLSLIDRSVAVPDGYVSGSPMHATTDYWGTLAGLGLREGRWSFGLANGERVTVNVAAVPLPPAGVLLAGGLLALLALSWGRRAPA